MSENIDVNVNFNSTQANRNINQLNSSLGTLNKTFTSFRSLLGGLAIGSFITSTLRFAASMVDVSKSTDIALESVIGFGRAVQDNGGSIDDASNALQRLNSTIGEAAQGSATAQDAFRKVGVTLNDLRTLSQTEILQKTIQGLAKITDASKRAALANDILGKSFKGVDIVGVANEFDAAVAGSAKYAVAIKKADDVQQKLEKSITDLRLVLLQIIEPFTVIAEKIDVTSESFQRFVNGLKAVGLAVGVILLVLSPLGRVVGGLITLFRNFRATLATFGNFKMMFKEIFIAMTKGFEKFKGEIKGVRDAIKKNLGKGTTKEDLKVLSNIEQAFYQVVKAGKAALAILGLGGIFAIGASQDVSTPERGTPKGPQGRRRLSEEERQQIRDMADANEKRRKSIEEVTQAYKRNIAQQIADINIQRLAIDMSQDEVEVMNAVNDVIKKNEDAILSLRNQRDQLAEDDPLRKTIEGQIAVLERSLETDKRLTAESVRNLQKRQLEQEKLSHVIEQTNTALSAGASIQALQDRLATVGMIGDELENNLVKLDVERELQSTLNALSLRALELEQQRTRLGEARYQQELANLIALTDQAYKYAEIRLEAEQKILEAQKAVQENAKLGAQQAIENIANQFKPYQMAQDAIAMGWRKISDAIDTFIETGKFNFKEFARSILADLAKMIAKALVFKYIFKPLMGALGLPVPEFRAAGGPVQAKTPYMVGERGPELFVPAGAGKIVPNNELGGGSKSVNAPITNNYNTYNINALDAKSVAQLFAENRKAIFGANKMAEREMSYAGVR